MIRLFKVSIPGSVIALVVSETALLFSCYVLIAYRTLDVAPDIFLIDDGGLWHIALVVAVIQMGLYFLDLYESYRIRSRIILIQQFCMVLGVAFLLQALASYGRWDALVLPKWLMLYGSLLVLIVLPLWRIIFTTFLRKAVGAERLLFLGTSQAVQQIIARLGDRAELGLTAIGYLDDETKHPPPVAGAPKLGTLADLDLVVEAQSPARIVVGLTESRNRLPVQRLLELRYSGIHVEEAAATYEAVFGRVSTRDLRPSQLIFSAELGPRRSRMALQTVYSLLLSLLGIVVMVPVMAAVAIIVKVSTPGPVLVRQKRVGLNDAAFVLYKFRSMYKDSEAATGAVWAVKDDPRITPAGRWLRKLRLDELPQLFNVIRGEMSLVGPRPERPEIVAVLGEQIPYYRQRHCVKPGITGWAQINCKYGDSIEGAIMKLEYDLYYIKNMAVSLDVYILFHTAKTMLLGRGAQ